MVKACRSGPGSVFGEEFTEFLTLSAHARADFVRRYGRASADRPVPVPAKRTREADGPENGNRRAPRRGPAGLEPLGKWWCVSASVRQEEVQVSAGDVNDPEAVPWKPKLVEPAADRAPL